MMVLWGTTVASQPALKMGSGFQWQPLMAETCIDAGIAITTAQLAQVGMSVLLALLDTTNPQIPPSAHTVGNFGEIA